MNYLQKKIINNRTPPTHLREEIVCTCVTVP